MVNELPKVNKKSSSLSDKLPVFLVILVLLILGSLVWMKMKIDQKDQLKPPVVSQPEEEQPILPPSYQKGIPQQAETPSAQAGDIKIVNDEGVAKKIGIDTSTPIREGLYNLFRDTLKGMGYYLTVYNRASLTNEFTIPAGTNPSGSYSSGCTKYGYRWNSQTGNLDLFFFIDNPEEVCDQEKFFVPMLNAVGHAKGEIFDWWQEGRQVVAGSKQLTSEDLPIGIYP